MKRTVVIELVSFLLILLWVYASLSKMLDYEQSRKEMMNQIFPDAINEVLLWAVPLTEMILAGSLLIPRFRVAGLYGSLVLLIVFTIYILLVMGNAFGRIPCSCGGILEKMNWETHAIFNLSFICLAITGIYMDHKNTSAKTLQKDIVGQQSGNAENLRKK